MYHTRRPLLPLSSSFRSTVFSAVTCSNKHQMNMCQLLSTKTRKPRVKSSIKSNDAILEVSSFAKIDLDREGRTGFPEVIFGSGKTAKQIADIIEATSASGKNMIATRVSSQQYQHLKKHLAKDIEVTYHEECSILHTRRLDTTSAPTDAPIAQTKTLNGSVCVVCAGTSDYAVAEEAAKLLELSGVKNVVRVYDVGVAGISRLLGKIDEIRKCDVVIAVAGMDGALPSVLGGLVKSPVIACPTSVGYGASFGGVAGLLTMLNTCAPGVSVVNIDNGFGAAVSAFKIINLLHEKGQQT